MTQHKLDRDPREPPFGSGPCLVEAFAKLYFGEETTQDQLHAVLAPLVARFNALSGGGEQADFRGQLTDYVWLYALLRTTLESFDRKRDEGQLYSAKIELDIKVDDWERQTTLPTEESH